MSRLEEIKEQHAETGHLSPENAAWLIAEVDRMCDVVHQAVEMAAAHD